MFRTKYRTVRQRGSNGVGGTLRLNLGCGLQAPAGWTNIDRSPGLILDRLPGAKSVLYRIGLLADAHMVTWPRSIKLADVTKALPYPTGTVAAIYSSHMLEHIYFDQALALLGECHRVLQPDGILRVALPDVRVFARQLLSATEDEAAAAGLKFTQLLNAGPLHKPNRRQKLTQFVGASPHRWQPTSALVINMMREAGFADPQSREFMVGDLPGLAEVEHRPEGLFVEARR
ncbi:Methyltransferase domain-containing protein [Micromonospora phaseoli]|uniref:Methyltransferase domain-containing protein n=1 Tax=Micromonospora phaseoli TaxID=1144548 RepID=A0A1H6SI40_9ACTN|nr:methyltransferase domain-containing protein [Micromonospora phaseoli]PZW03898.1 methyltransferase family protein [Micromonospora phaseoli]SEI65554.1 Methyltransferase domain-containing protein [Micromonospora phaseoli]